MNTISLRGELNEWARCGVQQFAILLLTAALALPAERNMSSSAAEPVKDSEPTYTHPAKPNRKAASRVLGKVNPLRLLQRLDAATTDLAIRFSSWHTDLPGSEELPKAAKGKALIAASERPARELSEHEGGWQRTCQSDGESLKERP